MNQTHIIAFLIGAIAEACLIILGQWWETRKDGVKLGRSVEADSVFERSSDNH